MSNNKSFNTAKVTGSILAVTISMLFIFANNNKQEDIQREINSISQEVEEVSINSNLSNDPVIDISKIKLDPQSKDCVSPDQRKRGTGQAGCYDFYTFSQFWGNIFCTKTTPEGECIKDGLEHDIINSLAPHGIWPMYHTKTETKFPSFPTNCTGNQTRLNLSNFPKEDRDRVLKIYSGNKGLMQHEWNKHGTCTNLKPVEFFRLIAAIHEGLLPVTQQLVDNAGKSLTYDEILGMLNTTRHTQISCSYSKNKNTQHLFEIRTNLNREEMTVLNIDMGIDKPCDVTKPIYIPKVTDKL